MENSRERKYIKWDIGMKQVKTFRSMSTFKDFEEMVKSGRKILIFDVGLDGEIFTEMFIHNPDNK